MDSTRRITDLKSGIKKDLKRQLKIWFLILSINQQREQNLLHTFLFLIFRLSRKTLKQKTRVWCQSAYMEEMEVRRQGWVVMVLLLLLLLLLECEEVLRQRHRRRNHHPTTSAQLVLHALSLSRSLSRSRLDLGNGGSGCNGGLVFVSRSTLIYRVLNPWTRIR